MECFKQTTEEQCSEDFLDNENIRYKDFNKSFKWISNFKNYSMNWKCIHMGSSFISCLTKISQKAVFLSVFLFMTFLISHCRQNLYHQDFKNCRLFPQHSIVKDYIYGETELLHNDLINSDLSFVVYYAPWDRDSNQFKSIFYKAAVHFHEQINFASINCWYPEGKCRKAEGLMKYPVVILHARLPSNKKAINIEYTGPLLLPHVHRFLSRALKPIAYVANEAELDEQQLLYQVVILGCFNDQVPSNFYNFYYASLVLLHFSYMTDVTYAATYNLSLCGGRSRIKFITWHKSIIFPITDHYKTRDIVLFVEENIPLLMPKWLPVHEYRSSTLSNLAAKGPLLIAFVPDDPYSPANDAYLTLRRIVLEYTNCKSDLKIRHQIEKLRVLAKRNIESMKDLCLKLSEETIQDSSKSDFIYTDSWCKYGLENDSNQCNTYGSNEYCLLEGNLWPEKDNLAEFSLLRNLKYYYYKSSVLKTKNNNVTQSSSACKDYMVPTMPVGPIKDENIALSKKWLLDNQCGKQLSHSSTRQIDLSKSLQNISGLLCSTNKTLNFVALNSVQKADFTLTTNKFSQSNVWIVDSESEVFYNMKDNFSRDSLVAFIYNYTHGLLDRKHINLIKDVSTVPMNSLSIDELTADNYLNVTQEIGRAFVVLHYVPYCGACKSIGSMYLACKSLFKNIPELTFARIDVSKNSLPWYLTFTRVPQIIFHPSRKKAETDVFDTSIEINTQSLLLFLLSKLDVKTRLNFARLHI